MSDKNKPDPILDEIEEFFGLNTQEYKRQKAATNQHRKMLLQGRERYPGMHDDLLFCIGFSERQEGEISDFHDACRRLEACGAWKDGPLVLPKKGEAPQVRENVVSFVGRLLGWDRKK